MTEDSDPEQSHTAVGVGVVKSAQMLGIFSRQTTGLPDRSSMGYERKRNEGLSLDLSNWPPGVAIYEMEGTA